MKQQSIHFETAVSQGHYQHCQIEKKIHLLQDSLEQAELRNSAMTITGWLTLGNIIEKSVNLIPLGYLHHESGGINLLLQILTPNNL